MAYDWNKVAKPTNIDSMSSEELDRYYRAETGILHNLGFRTLEQKNEAMQGMTQAERDALHSRAEELRGRVGYSSGSQGQTYTKLEQPQTPQTQPTAPTPQQQPTQYTPPQNPLPSSTIGYSGAGSYTDMKNTWTPAMSEQDFMGKVRQIGQTQANLKYNTIADDLKTRMARILADKNARLTGLDAQYQQAYQTNTQNTYNAQEDVKKILARRGLLGSGVDVGNQLATGATYGQQRQDIDLQKEGERSTIQNDINATNEELERSLHDIERQRGDYLANIEAQSWKDYQDYVQGQKAFDFDNYWKAKQYDLGVGSLDQQAIQFTQNLGLEYDKLSQQDRQFYASLAQDMEKFNKSLEVQTQQFAQNSGIEWAKLKQQGDQFDKTMGFNQQQLAQQNSIAYAQMANDLARNNANIELARAQFALEKAQFDADFQLAVAGLNQQSKQFYTDENNRIDSLLGDAIMKMSQDPSLKAQVGPLMMSIVSSSGLSEGMKEQKLGMIRETFGIQAPAPQRPDAISGAQPKSQYTPNTGGNTNSGSQVNAGKSIIDALLGLAGVGTGMGR